MNILKRYIFKSRNIYEEISAAKNESEKILSDCRKEVAKYFADYINSITFRNKMIERYKHSTDTLISDLVLVSILIKQRILPYRKIPIGEEGIDYCRLYGRENYELIEKYKHITEQIDTLFEERVIDEYIFSEACELSICHEDDFFQVIEREILSDCDYSYFMYADYYPIIEAYEKLLNNNSEVILPIIQEVINRRWE